MNKKPIRILITGPEATGKSWMSQQLADHFGSLRVPEYARSYLTELGRPYVEEDLVKILRGQLDTEEHLAKQTNDFLFSDTGPEVIYLWSQVKYGHVHPSIQEAVDQLHYDTVLLMDVDLPWEYDPLRELPDLEQRKKLWELYYALLTRAKVPFGCISGTGQDRFRAALTYLMQQGISL